MGTATFPPLLYLRFLQPGVVFSTTHSFVRQEQLFLASLCSLTSIRRFSASVSGMNMIKAAQDVCKVSSSIMHIPYELCDDDFCAQQP